MLDLPELETDEALYAYADRLTYLEHALAMRDVARSLRWTAFSDAMPEPHRKLLVTNCADCRDAFGFASHVWIVDMVHPHETAYDFGGRRLADAGEVTAFAQPSDMPLRNLTHWRYALPEER